MIISSDLMPSRILFARETDSNGCIVCPTTASLCPACPNGQVCELKSQTCDTCSEYICVTNDNGGSSSVPIGGIVGGVVGGVFLLGIIGALYWYYKYIYSKNAPQLSDDSDDIMMQSTGKDGDESIYPISNMESQFADPNSLPLPNEFQEKPVAARAPNNKTAKRISSYDSFTKHKKAYPTKNRTAKETAALQRRERQRQIALQANKNLQGLQGFDDPANRRNSIATTVSTSNASNILPIAYIPGVTVRPTKNNTRSVYSFDSDSVFSDLNTIENASIVGDVMRANNNSEVMLTPVPNSTTTAIKAQPKLVSVDKIEEENEDHYDDSDIDIDTTLESSLDTSYSHKIISSSSNFNNLTQVSDTIEESSDDSDIDSDMENITRATSLRHPKKREVLLDMPLSQTQQPVHQSPTEPLPMRASLNEIPISFIDYDKKDAHTLASGAGSFLLDVEMDEHGESPHSGEESPFNDAVSP